MYPGAVVRVHGLSSRSDLNGCEAEVLDSVSGGRCGVRIVASGEQVRVRPANLREQHSGPDDIRLTDADGIVYGSDEFMQNNRVPDFAALLYAEAAEQGLDVSRLDVKVPSLLPPPYEADPAVSPAQLWLRRAPPRVPRATDSSGMRLRTGLGPAPGGSLKRLGGSLSVARLRG